MRNPSFDAKQEIKRDEELRLLAYRDFKGVWTIGWGHTRGVQQGDQITEREAIDFLDEDLADAIRTIYRHLPAGLVDELPQKCFDSLVSFIFNVGAQAFINQKTGKRTDFYRAITTDLELVPAQMQRWVRSGDRVAPGLVKRRGREAALWGLGLLDRIPPRAGPPGIMPEPESDDGSVTPDEPRADKVTKQPIGVTGVAVGTGGAGVVGAAVMEAAGATRGMGSDSLVLTTIGVMLTLIGVALIAWATWRRMRK